MAFQTTGLSAMATCSRSIPHAGSKAGVPDAAVTIPIGNCRSERLRLVNVAEEVLKIAIAEIARRRWWSEVAVRMERHVKEAGFSVVEQYVGHGIGRDMHESPQVPNFLNKDLAEARRFPVGTGTGFGG